jgi:hypothetical protein
MGQLGVGVVAVVASAATSQETGSTGTVGLVMVTAPTTAAMKNNTAATCSTGPKLASVSVLVAISPTQAVAIRAERPPTAFWIAEAIPPCSRATDDKFSAVNGVLVNR